MRKSWSALVVVPLLLFGTAAVGCEGAKVVFEDNFTDDLGGWGDDENIKIADGVMSVLVNPKELSKGGNNTQFNEVFVIRDGDICVDTMLPSSLDAAPAVGLAFWAVDYSNFYFVQVQKQGEVSIFRKASGAYSIIFTTRPGVANWGPSARNKLRVVINGVRVSVYVNGTKIREFRGQVPENPWKFGVYAEYNKAPTNAEMRRMGFQNFKVTSVD